MSNLYTGILNSLMLTIAVSCSPFFVGGGGDGERVYGAVTVDGQTVEQDAISFKSLGNKSSVAGAMIREGKYEAIVPLGKSKFVFRSISKPSVQSCHCPSPRNTCCRPALEPSSPQYLRRW